MAAWRLRLQTLADRELFIAVIVSGATMLVAFAGAHKLGTMGLLAPLALVLVVILLRRPTMLVMLVIGLLIVCEGPSFGLFHFTSHLYDPIYKGLTPVDALVVLAILGVGLDMIRGRRPPRVPAPLAVGLSMLVLAMVAGAVTGHAAGASIRTVLLSENVLAYLLLLPIAVANLQIDRRQIALLLQGAAVLAILKAALGLIEIAGGYGSVIEGSARLTYYEPSANWLIMIAVFGVLALVLARVRLPLWVLLGSPLLVASLVFSYRRSFWIACILGILLVLLLGTSPVGRRLLLPTGLLIAVAIWLLGSVNFQSSESPLGRRVASLTPSNLEANVQDRYRLDERANVLGEIRRQPITGLGLTVPWNASFRPLSVEHVEGRQYVHFAALWFWLKLGILGLVAYVTLMIGAAVLAWQAWRRSHEPLLRAFGLASLCAFAGLVVIETTASFTGVDLRFTVLLGTQLGLLALIAQSATPGG